MLCSFKRSLIEFSCRGTNMFCDTYRIAEGVCMCGSILHRSESTRTDWNALGTRTKIGRRSGASQVMLDIVLQGPMYEALLCSSTRFLIEFSCRGTNMFCSTPIHVSMHCCCHHRVKHTSLLRLPSQKTHAVGMMFGCLPHSWGCVHVRKHLAQERVDKHRLKCICYSNQD